MNYEFRVCSFIDILGFSHHIDESIIGEKDVEAKIQSIASAIEVISNTPTRGNEEFAQTKRITQFSDSIVISFKLDDQDQVFHTLMDYMFISLDLVTKGYLLRGGITWGKLIHTDKSIFGPAMVDAYKLETKRAIFPRIIVNKDIYDLGKLVYNGDPETLREVLDNILTEDDDGELYIDYISKANSEFNEPVYDTLTYINSLKDIIEKAMATKNPTVISKMYWLKNKVNNYIENLIEGAHQTDNYDGDYDIVQVYRSLVKIPM